MRKNAEICAGLLSAHHDRVHVRVLLFHRVSQRVTVAFKEPRKPLLRDDEAVKVVRSS